MNAQLFLVSQIVLKVEAYQMSDLLLKFGMLGKRGANHITRIICKHVQRGYSKKKGDESDATNSCKRLAISFKNPALPFW